MEQMPTDDDFNHILSETFDKCFLNSSDIYTLGAWNFRDFAKLILIDIIVSVLVLILFTGCKFYAIKFKDDSIEYSSALQFFYEDKLTIEDLPVEERLTFKVSPKCMIFSWIRNLYYIRYENIKMLRGDDAMYYLSFHRHLMFIAVCMAIFCTCFVMSANTQGSLGDERYLFAHTTMSNVPPKSSIIWGHVVTNYLTTLISICCIRMFSRTLRSKDLPYWVKASIMIKNVELKFRDRMSLLNYFRENFSSCEVFEIQLTYDIRKLSKLIEKREIAYEAHEWCKKFIKRLLIHPRVVPTKRLIPCLPSESVDAFDYYTENLQLFTSAINQEEVALVFNPLSTVFVTFLTKEMVKEVLVYKYKKNLLALFDKPKHPKASVWTLSKAPDPENIMWENLSTSKMILWASIVAFNIIMVGFLILITVPLFLLKYFATQYKDLYELVVISEIVPPFIFGIYLAFIPSIISALVQKFHFETKSSLYLSKMKHVYFHSMFAIFFLPLIVLMSLSTTFIDMDPFYSKNMWLCMSIPYVTGFFLSLVATSILMCNSLLLLNIPTLFRLLCNYYHCISGAEKPSLFKRFLQTFNYDVHYVSSLIIFNISAVFGETSPLIASFSLVYFIVKYFVDKYNICFGCQKTTITHSIHISAIQFLVFSLILKNLMLLLVIIFRKDMDNILYTTILGFICVTIICLMQLYMPSIPNVGFLSMPHNSDSRKKIPADEIDPERVYLPKILKRRQPYDKDKNLAQATQT